MWRAPSDLFEGSARIETVVVEDVDVVDTEAPQALVQAREQVFARAEVAVWAWPHVPPGFRRDHELVPVSSKVRLQDPAEVRFGAAVRRAVVVRQVEVRDPKIEGAPQDGALTVERSVGAEVVPQAQGDFREQETAAPTAAIAHRGVAVVSGLVAGAVGHAQIVADRNGVEAHHPLG